MVPINYAVTVYLVTMAEKINRLVNQVYCEHYTLKNSFISDTSAHSF